MSIDLFGRPLDAFNSQDLQQLNEVLPLVIRIEELEKQLQKSTSSHAHERLIKNEQDLFRLENMYKTLNEELSKKDAVIAKVKDEFIGINQLSSHFVTRKVASLEEEIKNLVKTTDEVLGKLVFIELSHTSDSTTLKMLDEQFKKHLKDFQHFKSMFYVELEKLSTKV